MRIPFRQERSPGSLFLLLRELKKGLENAFDSDLRTSAQQRTRVIEELLGFDDSIFTSLDELSAEVARLGTPDLVKKVREIQKRLKLDERERERELLWFGWIVLPLTVLGLAAGIGMIFLVRWFLLKRWLTWSVELVGYTGTLGDSFGVVNATFGALAFGGVLYTVILQRKELALQRDEIRRSRREAKRSADSLNEQVELSQRVAKISAMSEAAANLNPDLAASPLMAREVSGRKDWYLAQISPQVAFILHNNGPSLGTAGFSRTIYSQGLEAEQARWMARNVEPRMDLAELTELARDVADKLAYLAGYTRLAYPNGSVESALFGDLALELQTVEGLFGQPRIPISGIEVSIEVLFGHMHFIIGVNYSPTFFYQNASELPRDADGAPPRRRRSSYRGFRRRRPRS